MLSQEIEFTSSLDSAHSVRIDLWNKTPSLYW